MASKAQLKTLLDGHQAMTTVLGSRSLRLNAALTFWQKNDIPQLVSYLLRMKDDGLFIDVLPFITKRISEDELSNKNQVTLGACLELIPVIGRLLQKKYEDYVIVCLDFIRTMIKRWYKELRSMGQMQPNNQLDKSLSLSPVYTQLLAMSAIVEKLSKRDGKIGNKAKVVLEMLKQLE